MYRDLRDSFLAHFKPLIATLSDHQKDLLAEALWQLGLECMPERVSERWAERGKRHGSDMSLFQYGSGIRSAALAVTRIIIQKQLTEEKRMAKLGLPFGEDGPR